MIDKLQKITSLKEKFIEERKKILASNVSDLQKKLYKKLFTQLLDALDTEQGNILNSDANLTRISVIDKIFRDFEKELAKTMRGVATDYNNILSYNNNYYSQFNTALFSSVKKTVHDAMLARTGITSNGGFEKDGFIDSFIADKTISRQVKQTVLSGVMNGTKMSELIKTLNTTIEGTETNAGVLENHFRTFVYDTYSQFDRESSNQFAVQLDMNYAIYGGGLVDASREFCIKRNGKVFTRNEIHQFGTPQDKFGGYTNKSKGQFQGKPKNYIPERDMGGYNCGHTYEWVSYAIAKTLRPDIPKYKAAA